MKAWSRPHDPYVLPTHVSGSLSGPESADYLSPREAQGVFAEVSESQNKWALVVLLSSYAIKCKTRCISGNLLGGIGCWFD